MVKSLLYLVVEINQLSRKTLKRQRRFSKELKSREMEISKFDIADYLDSNEMIAEYLNAVLAEGNDSDVIIAIGHIAKSIGMTKIAQETGLSRPSLYKALSDGSKPQFETIMKVLRAIGGQIQIHPMTT
jgi:probable addiction module antidote protein